MWADPLTNRWAAPKRLVSKRGRKYLKSIQNADTAWIHLETSLKGVWNGTNAAVATCYYERD